MTDESLTAKLAEKDRYIAALEKRVSDLLLRLPLDQRYAEPAILPPPASPG
jgi:hypothetical protein